MGKAAKSRLFQIEGPVACQERLPVSDGTMFNAYAVPTAG